MKIDRGSEHFRGFVVKLHFEFLQVKVSPSGRTELRSPGDDLNSLWCEPHKPAQGRIDRKWFIAEHEPISVTRQWLQWAVALATDEAVHDAKVPSLGRVMQFAVGIN